MKKKSEESRINDLMIDIVEYAFTEWLVRRGVFTSFKLNYESTVSPYKTFRDRLRAHVRRSLSSPCYDPSSLISSAFLFTATPEGSNFWEEQSTAWERFYVRFQSRL